ncbi:enoyl-CoA hydratase/isomerase family protein [Nocardioides sp.]|uniref:enoyl-CoA hydratase/isomerase family protein n=1 Tax=Nocardioides sp. TaxID=35761 RepID=UPI0027374FCC|nr:enoyl-CoA hydratase/isomerase family protein [Nocardioides sp.]MDP3891453.1 enoyl-CoA hydratase/isomerase family protein [Nocardioides sp.]
MATQLVTFERVGSVGRIELNRPDASNAVDLPTASSFGVALASAVEDPEVRVIVLTGAGKRFCAGGDVGSMALADDRSAYLRDLAEALDGVLQQLAAIDMPVVVGVQGAVAGAGLAVMLSGDLVVAGESTRFVTAYAGVGLTPDCGLSWLLPRAVGHQRAAELCLTGRALTATQAQDWGMVTRVVDDAAVADEAMALGEQLAQGPAYALGQARLLLREGWARTRAEAGAVESEVIATAVTTADAQRLIDAFVGR